MENKNQKNIVPENKVPVSPKDAPPQPINSEEEKRKNLTDALVREIYYLKESVEKLKANNNMLHELISVNMENTGKTPKEALISKLMQENEVYKKLAVQRIKDIIYNKVKEEYPDVTYNSFEEFPEDFHRLVCARVSPGTAYKVVSSKLKEKKPEDMGKVNGNSDKERDFYSSKEVDKLTKKQLSNPKVMETVLKSMLKW